MHVPCIVIQFADELSTAWCTRSRKYTRTCTVHYGARALFFLSLALPRALAFRQLRPKPHRQWTSNPNFPTAAKAAAKGDLVHRVNYYIGEQFNVAEIVTKWSGRER